MTGPVTGTASSIPAPARPGLLSRLMAVVRPECRADELVFDPADPVFGGGLCLVPVCERTARSRGLCAAHHDRWQADSRPDVEEFAASTDPRWRKQMPLACCRAPGCGRGVTRQGLCSRHGAAWERGGQPDLEQWSAAQPETSPPVPLLVCRIEFCQLWAEKDIAFCLGHGNTWKVNGRPDVEEFARGYTEIDPVPRNERGERQLSSINLFPAQAAKISEGETVKHLWLTENGNPTFVFPEKRLA